MNPTEEELKSLLDKAKGSLDEKGQEKLKDLVDAYAYARKLLGEDGMTVERFRSLFYSRLSEMRSGIFEVKASAQEENADNLNEGAHSQEERDTER
jgi:hypothetical protein